MPLVSENLSERPTHRIETEDGSGDWYEIITVLSGHEREKLMQDQAIIKMPRGKVDEISPDEVVTVLPNNAQFNHLCKRTLMRRWSHSDRITDKDLDRMPVDHDKQVMKAIREVLEGQFGATKDSPLESLSKTASEPLSSSSEA